jgi:glycosyltransferase involved in cell wall biosynthesis
LIAHNAADGRRYARTLQHLGVVTYAGPQSQRAGDEYLRHPEKLLAAAHFDLALISSWPVAEFYLPLLRFHSPATNVVIDSVDLHFLRRARSVFGQLASGDRTASLDSAYGDEVARELNLYAAADSVLAVSQKEADFVSDLLGRPGHVCVVPDMDDISPSPVPLAERRGIVFIGNFRHPPNVQAAEFLCRRIVPLLPNDSLRQDPLWIVGNDLDVRLPGVDSALPGVVMVGWVPSIEPYLHRARLSVVPLLHGAGTKRKLLQALMAGTPTVTTPVGVEGLDVRDGEHVLIAADAAEFASNVTLLLRDTALWQRLSDRGRAWAGQHHGADAVRKRFLDVLDTTLQLGRSGAGVPPELPA